MESSAGEGPSQESVIPSQLPVMKPTPWKLRFSLNDASTLLSSTLTLHCLVPSAPLLIGNFFEPQVTEIRTVAQTNRDLFIFFHLQICLLALSQGLTRLA